MPAQRQGAVTIGALSRQCGSNIETIRYYERIGLLANPTRGGNGYRFYGAQDIKRLRFIRRSRALGFSLAEVRRLLDLAEHPGNLCANVRGLAAAHLDDIQAKIADLKKMEAILSDTVSHCVASGKMSCPLIEALSA
jgi:MerR family transcriptional regulator, mercuric resistance operon regulatory protein